MNADLARLRQAQRTLAEGTRFLGHGLNVERAGPLRAKVLGNGLRELDRFFNLLVDAVATVSFPEAPMPAGFSGLRNTPNKLRAVRARLGQASPDHARLRAIGRSRDCLFHCGGIMRRPDLRGGAEMRPGWPIDSADRLAPGQRLEIQPADLRAVCRFYDHLARDLLAASTAYQAS